MRKLISTLLVGLVCFAFAGCNSNQKKDKEVVQDLKKTTDDQPTVDTTPQTYFITGPEGWKQSDSMVAGAKQTKITSPSDGGGDRFAENINVRTEAARGYSAASYADANFETLKTQMPGVVIEDQGATTIDGVPAHCYIYSLQYSGLDIKDIGWFLLKNDIAYVITCTALKLSFDRFEAKFRACANTFKIK